MAVFNYAENLTKYAVGRRVNSEEWNTVTRTFETAATLAFGVPVARGAGDHGCIAYAGSNFIGVTEASQMLNHVGDTYARYDNVAVCKMGVIGVLVGEAVTDGAAAGWDAGTGKWVLADTANPQVPGCVFETSGAADTVVALRVTPVA